MNYPMTWQYGNIPHVEETVLAYLAGVVDCDGYITIHRSRRKGVSYYAPVVGISGTRPDPHKLAASIYGGNVSAYKPKNKRHRVQHQWSRMGKGAVPMICQIYPFLRIKQPQADVAMELFEHMELGRSDDPYPWMSPNYNPKEYCEELTMMARDLNQSRKRMRTTWDEFPSPQGVTPSVNNETGG